MRNFKIFSLICLVNWPSLVAKNLSGDVSGYHKTNRITGVGGQTAASIAQATVAANSASSSNIPNSLVRRDSDGSIEVSKVKVTGSVDDATDLATKAYVDLAISEQVFAGTLAGDVTGSASATIVNEIDGIAANLIADATTAVLASTALPTANTLAKRDEAGDCAFNKVTLTEINSDAANQIALSVDLQPKITIDSQNIVLNNILCNNSVQVASPINHDTVSAAKSILLLTPTSDIANLNVVFPANPIDGQFFTIILGATATISNLDNLTSDSALIVNEINSLSASLGYTKAAYYFYAGSWYHVS